MQLEQLQHELRAWVSLKPTRQVANVQDVSGSPNAADGRVLVHGALAYEERSDKTMTHCGHPRVKTKTLNAEAVEVARSRGRGWHTHNADTITCFSAVSWYFWAHDSVRAIRASGSMTPNNAVYGDIGLGPPPAITAAVLGTRKVTT